MVYSDSGDGPFHRPCERFPEEIFSLRYPGGFEELNSVSDHDHMMYAFIKPSQNQALLDFPFLRADNSQTRS